MEARPFHALVVRKGADRRFSCAVEPRTLDDLPDGAVLVRVHASTINYKDGLSCQGHPAITRRFPHTPGVDAAGVVEASTDPAVTSGDRVAIISHAMGLTAPGGFGQYVRVPADWVMPLDDALSFEHAMAYGTAGFTAVLAVEALADAGVLGPGAQAVVTGATGGVGSLAVALLAARGVAVTAVTGKTDDRARAFLAEIGAAEVLARADVEDSSGRNMLLPRWDAAVDVAGGAALSTVIRSLCDGGAVAVTGMVQATAFDANVLPFILRGARLLGINAENTDAARRRAVWGRMATSGKPPALESVYTVVGLADLPAAVETVAAGRHLGRIVVDMRDPPPSPS
ncbi:acryloyl-CoA reductase [Roseospira navarrensis]|uniref:Acryloyl-CoA reductase n=1 Tax=Roseospira navarrensis TaxID=140058 RepID=A0A7X1ZHS1_9PROT|nr:acryloyl-CoA reductase [Roseospira navarrensis]MQX38209.1 acryloyl-CoA reductase [Roseospira navarrensis]